MVTREYTFGIKTLNPECTYPQHFKMGKLHKPMRQTGIWRILVKMASTQGYH